MSRHLSTLDLHRLRYGELDPQTSQAARSHLETCGRCAERFRSQQAQRAAFTLEPVPAALLSPTGRSPRSKILWWAAPVVMAVAGAMFFALPRPMDVSEHSDTRLKGSIAGLEVVAERQDHNVILAPGSVVMPGDRIQMRFDPGPYPYASLAGRDGTGLIEVYGIIEVAPDGLQPAPFALELDDTPGDQEFFAIYTHEPPDPVWLMEALEGGSIPDGAVITSIRLRKEIPR